MTDDNKPTEKETFEHKICNLLNKYPSLFPEEELIITQQQLSDLKQLHDQAILEKEQEIQRLKEELKSWKDNEY